MAEGPSAQRRGIKDVARAALIEHEGFLLILVGFSLVKLYYARILAIPMRSIPSTLLLETAAVVALLGLADLVRKRRPYLLDWAAYAFLSIATVANALYSQMFGAPIDPGMVAFAGQVGQVQTSVFEMVRRTHVALVADLPFMLVFALILARASRKSPPPERRRWRLGIVVGVASAVLVAQVGFALTLPSGVDQLAVAQQRGFLVQQIATVLRVPFATARQAAAPSTSGTTTTDPAFQATIESVRQASTGDRLAAFAPGAYKGSNVIVIQVESLMGSVIGSRIDGKEITPNLNKLVEQSWYFPNTFSQTSAGNTSDAEFSEASGLVPPLNGAAAIKYADRIIPALPRLLRDQGYDAVTMHANYIKFWNRDQLYPALGFRRWYDHTYFIDRDPMWHASDQILFTYGMKALDPLRQAGTPFYAQMITMSSHHPFRYPVEARRPLKLDPTRASSYIGRYVGAISYTDQAIGEFIAALKANGLFDKSIIVIYGDHTGLQPSSYSAVDKALMNEMVGRTFDIADRQRVSLLVHLPGQTQGSVSRETLGQVDIMPTVADALGLDISAVPHVGKSAFVSSPGLVQTRAYLPGGTTITDRSIFVPGLTPTDGKAYSIESGVPIAVTPQDLAAYERANRLNELSDQWVGRLPLRPDASQSQDRGF